MKKLFSSEETRFVLRTGIEFSVIFMCIVAIIGYLLWLVLGLNSAFFVAHGFIGSEILAGAFFDHALLNASYWLPYLMGIFVSVFIAGSLLALTLLKPFKSIRDCCLKGLAGEDLNYHPGYFFDYRLLSQFSEHFFDYCEEVMTKKEYYPKEIPKRFFHIRKPVFDPVYFTHFLALVMLISIASIMILHVSMVQMRESLTDFALVTIKVHTVQTSQFFQAQELFFDSITIVCAILLVVFYGLFGVYLYSKVSGAVFAFFSTMRSFMKGDENARIHLLGYTHVRPYGRVINQYLKFVVRESGNKKNLGMNEDLN